MISRGTAMVETALVMSIVLMLVFGLIQMSMIAFSQTAQDGAAFVAAREYSQNAAGGSSLAQSTAHQVFSHVNAADVAIKATSTNVTASASTLVPGLGIPGTPGTFPLQSSATEPLSATPNPIASAYPFSTSAQLSNYRDYASNVPIPTYAIVTAQTFGSGNGTNGFFAEFDCREKVYAQVSFPAYPSSGRHQSESHSQSHSGGGSNSWDPQNGMFKAIYQWDTGSTCS